MSKFLAKANGLREDADYGDFVEISKRRCPNPTRLG